MTENDFFRDGLWKEKEGGAKAELSKMVNADWSREKRGKERLGGGANEKWRDVGNERKRIASVKVAARIRGSLIFTWIIESDTSQRNARGII